MIMNLQRIAKSLQNQDELVTREIILNQIQRKGHIVHGSQAVNRQLPTHLRTEPKDWDLFAQKPKKAAQELVNTLKRRLGNGERFKIKAGKHRGTFKVKDNDKTIVDFSQQKGPIKTKNVLGLLVKDLTTVKAGTQKLVKNVKTEFRREKDLTTLQRIQELERIDQSIKF